MNPPAPAAKIDPAQVRSVKEWKHTSPLLGCRFDPIGAFIFAGSQDSTVQRWEVATGKNVALKGHKSWVRALAFQPKERLLFSGDYHGQVLAWQADADTPEPVRSLAAHRGWVRAMAVSPDGALLATCGNDHLVKLWSLADGKLMRELTGHASHVYHLAFHPQGKDLASADLMGVLKHWDVARGTPVRELDARVLHKYDTTFRADIGGVRSMAFNRDGSLLACAGIAEVTNAFAGVGRPHVLLFDWLTGARKIDLVAKEAFQGTAWGVVFHPDGFIAGTGGGSGGALWFWKPDQAQAFFTLKLPTNARDLSLSPDGRLLAVPFFDGAVRVYDLTAKVDS